MSPHQYGIVMDAGSSHTSVYIYKWPSEKDNDTGRVEEMHSCPVAGTYNAHQESFQIIDGDAIATVTGAKWLLQRC